MSDDNLVYTLDGKIYINLTNKCTNACIFCLRSQKDDVCGKNLWLTDENFTAADVIEQLKAQAPSGEIIFCGYGEPMLKLDILKEVAAYIKENHPNVKIRINTNGTANAVYRRDVTPELKGLVDEISVSLNAENEKIYNELSQPAVENAYAEVKKFIKASSDAGIETVASVVSGYKDFDIDLKMCEEIATDLGAKFRVREWIENGYE